MIILEYIIAQYQDENVSVAIHSTKPRQQNPALVIRRSGTGYIWRLTGLQIGEVENIQGQQRANRLDFYIGLEDLIEQRNLFPATRAASLGLAQGLRIPAGKERRGGKQIRWNGAVGRVPVEDVRMIIPPFSLRCNDQSDLILNVDKETSPYPITSDGGNQTMKELHIGIEHIFSVRQRGNLRIPRIDFQMTARQYATVLEAIDKVILQYQLI